MADIKLLNGFERVANDTAVSPAGALAVGETLNFPVDNGANGPAATQESPVVIFYALQEDYTLDGTGAAGKLSAAHEKLLGLRIWGKMQPATVNASNFPVVMSAIVRAADDNEVMLPKELLTIAGANDQPAARPIAKLTMVAAGPLDGDVDVLRGVVPQTLKPKANGVDLGAENGRRFGAGRFNILDALQKVVIGARGIFPVGTRKQDAAGGYILPARTGLGEGDAAELARVRPTLRIAGRRASTQERMLVSEAEGDLVAILAWGDKADAFVIAAASLEALRLAVSSPNLDFGRDQSGIVGGVQFVGAEVVRPAAETGNIGHTPAILVGHFGGLAAPDAAAVYDAWSKQPVSAEPYETLAAFGYGAFAHLYSGMMQVGESLYIGQKKQVRFYASAVEPNGEEDAFKYPNVAEDDIVRVGNVLWRCLSAEEDADAEWKRMNPDFSQSEILADDLRISGGDEGDLDDEKSFDDWAFITFFWEGEQPRDETTTPQAAFATNGANISWGFESGARYSRVTKISETKFAVAGETRQRVVKVVGSGRL